MASSLPLTLRAYQTLCATLMPLTSLIIKRRLAQDKEDPARCDERRGISDTLRPPGPLVWIHGASVGEVLAAAALIERLRALNIRILLTSGTVTSAAIIARRFGPDLIHQYVPYDLPRFVERFLDHWRPSLALFIESDLWPNLILSSATRRLPMVLINGRMSHRSFTRWRRMPVTVSDLLGRFDICLAQSVADAERFAALGCRNVVSTGNLKLDVPAPPADSAKLEHLMAAAQNRPIIVAASTHPGEEEILIEAHRTLKTFFPMILSIIVPRHANRGHDIAGMIAAAGLRVKLRSHDELPAAITDIYVADTMGELGLFYRLSPIVFMGGSLVAHGGQNPVEAIKLGAAIVHGPHVFNFADIFASLDKAGGARQADTKTRWSSNSGNCWQIRWPVRSPPTRRRWSWSSSVARWSAPFPRSSPTCCNCGSRWARRMREPAFWYRPPSLPMRLLRPFGAVYGAVAARRLQREGLNAGIPVLCVGNFSVGGAGKTPAVLALAKLLRAVGETPVVLSRGYGGTLRGPIAVDGERHLATQVGDEPLMMASSVPVVVARDRAGGVALARSLGASVILMDDGFQNPAIVKDISLIVIDSERGLGNGGVFPAGPLRAPLPAQLRRTDALVIVGAGLAANAIAAAVAASSKPVYRAHLTPDQQSLATLRGKRLLAFAGIGDTARFFRTLHAGGLNVVATRASPTIIRFPAMKYGGCKRKPGKMD